MKKLEDVEAVEREKAIFECDVSDPEADVTWWRGEKVHNSCLLLLGHSFSWVKAFCSCFCFLAAEIGNFFS